MDDAKELPLLDKADRVNDFVNNTVTYATDSINYGRGDYWASGVETICKGEGDCEDFALAKFYALKYLNVPENRMFLLWISDTVAHDGHMVLGVDTSAVNNWTNCLILDNYEGTANSLKTLGQTDYAPFLVDAVNSQEILGCKAKILKPPAP
jgi:predicted transglutaminase-like cysteine proteinase